MTACQLLPTPFAAGMDLVALGLATMDEVSRYTSYLHTGGGMRTLIVVVSVDEFSLEDAFYHYMGVRRWQHISVSVKGSLDARLQDQKRIGRAREGGERSPAPLPDWYDLSHIAYVHARETGMDPNRPVWQYLPPSWEPRLNIAEALHLRQPR